MGIMDKLLGREPKGEPEAVTASEPEAVTASEPVAETPKSEPLVVPGPNVSEASTPAQVADIGYDQNQRYADERATEFGDDAGPSL